MKIFFYKNNLKSFFIKLFLRNETVSIAPINKIRNFKSLKNFLNKFMNFF